MLLSQDDWKRGYAAGWMDATRDAAGGMDSRTTENIEIVKTPKVKRKRKASPYNRRYAAAFKRIAPKHKTKSGAWRKGGFKAANKAAHREARRGSK